MTAVRLGEVLRNVNDFVSDTTAPRPYVAGEHIDEGILDIDRHGSTTDDNFPPTFKRKFRAGQTLLHSRNPDKVAVPPFDGVTGEKLFVLEPVNRELDERLVPYLLTSSRFKRFLNGALRGSVNKYLNWSQLAMFEFPLPDAARQRRHSETLDASAHHIRSLRASAARAADARVAVAREGLSGPERPLAELCRIQTGFPFRAKEYADDGIRLLRGINVGVERVSWNEEDTRRWPAERLGEFAAYELSAGDIVLAMDRTVTSAGFKVSRLTGDDEPALLVQRVARLTPSSDDLTADYLWAYVHTPLFQKHVMRGQQTTVVPHISTRDIATAPVPVPPSAEQVRVGNAFRAGDRLIGALATQRAEAEQLHRTLVDVLLDVH